MKQIVLATLFAIVCLAPIKLNAQEILAGGGIAIATSEISTFGIGIRGDFRFAETWAVVPGLNFFFNKKADGTDGSVKYGLTTFNADAHYFFNMGEGFNLYPLAGLNLAFVRVKTDIDLFDDFKSSSTEVGLNIGGGADYVLTDRLVGYGEIKYVISNADQLVIALGVVYRIKE